MAKAKTDKVININTKNRVLHTLSELLGRAQLLSKLGKSYSNNRDLYEALGYPSTLYYDDYATKFERLDIANAVITKPVNATWRGEFKLVEADDDNETPFEKSWNELDDRLKLKSKFARLDKLVGLGRYGVLLLGFDDTRTKENFLQPVLGGKRQLLYVKPLSENHSEIKKYVEDVNDERYGLPEIYQITITNAQGNTSAINCHYSRILHVPGELLESEIFGAPRLKAIFNRLMDLEKLVGGSAEMFWRGARPGYMGKVNPEYTLTTDMKDDLQDQIDEFEHNLRRILVNEGIDDWKALGMEVADPKSHVDVQIEMISAVTGIPKRILTGSERGELASSQDKENWLEQIQTRRDEYAEPVIVRPFTDMCIELGILEKPGADRYNVDWSDLFAMSDQDKAEVGKTRALALKEYTSNPTAEMILPPSAFLKYFLGMDDDDIKQIEEMIDTDIREEENDFDSDGTPI